MIIYKYVINLCNFYDLLLTQLAGHVTFYE